MPQPPKPEIGFNIQVTKVTDLGGGQETVTINTGAPPGSSAQAIYGKLQIMRQALQKEIDFNRELERRRQAQEHEVAQSYLHAVGTRTPEDLPNPPATNGHDEDAERY